MSALRCEKTLSKARVIRWFSVDYPNLFATKLKKNHTMEPVRGQKFFGSTVPHDPVAPGELEIGYGLVQRTLVRVEIRKNKGNRLFSKRWTALDSHREPSAILT